METLWHLRENDFFSKSPSTNNIYAWLLVVVGLIV